MLGLGSWVGLKCHSWANLGHHNNILCFLFWSTLSLGCLFEEGVGGGMYQTHYVKIIVPECWWFSLFVSLHLEYMKQGTDITNTELLHLVHMKGLCTADVNTPLMKGQIDIMLLWSIVQIVGKCRKFRITINSLEDYCFFRLIPFLSFFLFSLKRAKDFENIKAKISTHLSQFNSRLVYWHDCKKIQYCQSLKYMWRNIITNKWSK